MSTSKEKTYTRRKTSDTVRIAVTLPGGGNNKGPVAFSGAITEATLEQMRPDPEHVAVTITKLTEMGFEVTG